MLEKMKEIFNKDNYDYSEGYVDPLRFHSTVYFVTKCYGLLNTTVPSWSPFLILFMMCCAVPAMTLSAMSMLHGFRISDVATIIEGGAYIIVLAYKMLILSCTKLNVPEFHMFLHTLKADFKYVCTRGARYRERFFKNQLETWKICLLVASAMTIISLLMVTMVALALIYYVSTHDPETGSGRPVLFPFWMFQVDFTKSPTYEIAFVFSNVCILAYAFNYIFMIETQILWVREIATKADLVIWGVQDLMKGIHPATNKREEEIFSRLIKYRMTSIIQQHQSMYDLTENYSRVYKKLLMFEQIFCGPVVCLTAYSAAEKLDGGEINYILFLLCGSTIIVNFVPSYLCTFLSIKVISVKDACWGIPFWNAGPVIRPYLVIMIQRSLRPLPLKAGGFQEVSVQTFSNKMASAYSCFNMLRQAFK
ncbi:uncharacterized protein [Epargyreus clarus]|uniref:uncharacterized protein n=1 Tax=Epargyreus clarus TaxID=520877 RepID=UPI003C2DFF29